MTAFVEYELDPHRLPGDLCLFLGDCYMETFEKLTHSSVQHLDRRQPALLL